MSVITLQSALLAKGKRDPNIASTKDKLRQLSLQLNKTCRQKKNFSTVQIFTGHTSRSRFLFAKSVCLMSAFSPRLEHDVCLSTVVYCTATFTKVQAMPVFPASVHENLVSLCPQLQRSSTYNVKLGKIQVVANARSCELGLPDSSLHNVKHKLCCHFRDTNLTEAPPQTRSSARLTSWLRS